MKAIQAIRSVLPRALSRMAVYAEYVAYAALTLAGLVSAASTAFGVYLFY